MALAGAPARSQTTAVSCATVIDLGFTEDGASVRYRTVAAASEGPLWLERVSGAGARTVARRISDCTWQALDDMNSNRWYANVSYAYNGSKDNFDGPHTYIDPTNVNSVLNGREWASESGGSGVSDVWVNAKWVARATAIYTLPWNVSVSGFLNGRQGYIYPYGWTTPDDLSFDKGVSSEDVPHNFKFSNVWEIPRMDVHPALSALVNGWMVNSIVTWQSGFPFSIVSGRDNSFTGINRDRADFTGDDASLGSGRSHGEMVTSYFDTSKFTFNQIGTYGNTGENILRAWSQTEEAAHRLRQERPASTATIEQLDGPGASRR